MEGDVGKELLQYPQEHALNERDVSQPRPGWERSFGLLSVGLRRTTQLKVGLEEEEVRLEGKVALDEEVAMYEEVALEEEVGRDEEVNTERWGEEEMLAG
jgi:hypothetical protein